MNKYTLLLLILILSSCDSNTLDSKKDKLDKLNNSLLDIRTRNKKFRRRDRIVRFWFQ